MSAFRDLLAKSRNRRQGDSSSGGSSDEETEATFLPRQFYKSTYVPRWVVETDESDVDEDDGDDDDDDDDEPEPVNVNNVAEEFLANREQVEGDHVDDDEEDGRDDGADMTGDIQFQEQYVVDMVVEGCCSKRCLSKWLGRQNFEWFAWDEHFNSPMKPLKGISSKHFFRVDCNGNEGCIELRSRPQEPTQRVCLLREGHNIPTTFPPVLPNAGLTEARKTYLSVKLLPMVPRCHQADFF